MQSLIGISHLLLILLLQLVPAQITPRSEEAPDRVMTFTEVYAKSMCQPMEQLVDVEQEFPGEVGYIYIPPCVPLQRCSGCCSDEMLECHPTLKRNVTVEIKRITLFASTKDVELEFVEHQRCECRLRQKFKEEKSSSESINNKLKKKNKKTASGCRKCPIIQEKISLP